MKLKIAACALSIAAALMPTVGSAKEKTIAFLRAGPNPFYQYGMNAVESAAKELGIKVVTYSANNDATQELANVQDAITKGVDGILIYGVSLSSQKAAIAQTSRANVPIFFQYGYSPDLLPQVAGFMQTDINTFGMPIGEHIGKQVREGKVAIITGKLGRGDAEAYSRGFRKGLEQVGSKAEVVAELPGDWNRQQAMDATAQLLSAHPDLKGLYVHNEDMAVGASIAIDRAGKTGQVVLGSSNGSPYGLGLIRDGKLAITNANPPSIASTQALRLLVEVIDGKRKGGQYYLAPTQVIDKSSVDKAFRWDASADDIKTWLKLPLPEPVVPAPK